jgi:hypothetical protein
VLPNPSAIDAIAHRLQHLKGNSDAVQSARNAPARRESVVKGW